MAITKHGSGKVIETEPASEDKPVRRSRKAKADQSTTPPVSPPPIPDDAPHEGDPHPGGE